VLFVCCLLFSSYPLIFTVRAEPTSQFILSSHGTIEYNQDLSNSDIDYEPSPSSDNLAVIPNSWGNYNGTDVYFNVGPQITHLETNPEHFHDGSISIRIDPHREGIDLNYARELNIRWTPVKPGDHIVFKCWIKTSSAANAANNGNPLYGGARIGIDFFGHSNLLASHPTNEEGLSSYVLFGSGWTLKIWDLIVPDTWFDIDNQWGSPNYGKPIPPQQIMGFIAWMQVVPVAETGVAWFSDAELYINP
jgi:hypothetical protein